jgi:hypothetical protein
MLPWRWPLRAESYCESNKINSFLWWQRQYSHLIWLHTVIRCEFLEFTWWWPIRSWKLWIEHSKSVCFCDDISLRWFLGHTSKMFKFVLPYWELRSLPLHIAHLGVLVRHMSEALSIISSAQINNRSKLRGSYSASKQYRLNYRRAGEVISTLEDRGCCVVPTAVNLGFLEWGR